MIEDHDDHFWLTESQVKAQNSDSGFSSKAIQL